MTALRDLWAGRLPLAHAFWLHAVTIGLAVNLAATAGMMAAIAAGLPGWAALAIHLSPLPYIAVCVVGVWRSALGEGPSGYWGEAARVAVIVWAAILVAL